MLCLFGRCRDCRLYDIAAAKGIYCLALKLKTNLGYLLAAIYQSVSYKTKLLALRTVFVSILVTKLME